MLSTTHGERDNSARTSSPPSPGTAKEGAVVAPPDDSYALASCITCVLGARHSAPARPGKLARALECRFHTIAHLIEREVRLYPRPRRLSHRLSPTGIDEKLGENLAVLGDLGFLVGSLDQDATIRSDELPLPSHVCAHDGNTRRHGLVQRQRNAFMRGRQKQHVARRDQFPDEAVRSRAEKRTCLPRRFRSTYRSIHERYGPSPTTRARNLCRASRKALAVFRKTSGCFCAVRRAG